MCRYRSTNTAPHIELTLFGLVTAWVNTAQTDDQRIGHIPMHWVTLDLILFLFLSFLCKNLVCSKIYNKLYPNRSESNSDRTFRKRYIYFVIIFKARNTREIFFRMVRFDERKTRKRPTGVPTKIGLREQRTRWSTVPMEYRMFAQHKRRVRVQSAKRQTDQSST